MNFLGKNAPAILAWLASVAATVLPLLVAQSVISPQLGAVIGGIVTAVLSGWHGNDLVKAHAAKAAAARAAKTAA